MPAFSFSTLLGMSPSDAFDLDLDCEPTADNDTQMGADVAGARLLPDPHGERKHQLYLTPPSPRRAARPRPIARAPRLRWRR